MSVVPVLSVLVLVVASMAADAVHAQASEASALSALPVGVLSAGPVVVLASGAVLTVVAVEASAAGTTWLVERASDGARASLRLAGRTAVAVGASVAVTAMVAGHVLSVAGQAVAFIPNELGAALLHNERVSR